MMYHRLLVCVFLCVGLVAGQDTEQLQPRFAAAQTGNRMEVQMETTPAAAPPVYSADAIQQYDISITSISNQIVNKGAQISYENKWIKQVNTVIAEYNGKILKVQSNVNTLRRDVRDLLKKRRQVQNLKLQKQLEQRLTDATADLSTLNSAISSVNAKDQSFHDTQHKLQNTITDLNRALAALKGETKPAPAANPTSLAETLKRLKIKKE